MLRQITGALILWWLFSTPSAAVVTEDKGELKKEENELCPEADSQFELNSCADREYKKEDDELNRIYLKILDEQRGDPVFTKKFREAQRAWLKFRDAQFEAMFPHILNSRGQYSNGSIFPMCAGLYKARLTHSRVEELRLWIDGTEEGDVCAGSLPIKKDP